MGALSLDLDNKWSYLKTRGDEAWRDYPSYLPAVVPFLQTYLAERRLEVTVFIVGKDCELPGHEPLLRSIAEAGHEIGNHSYRHEPWLHRYRDDEVRDEISRSTQVIQKATGVRPIGFRGPGYSVTDAVRETLADSDYSYDATTLPTWIGPLARAYYFRSTGLNRDDRKQREALFGRWRDGFLPNRPQLQTVNGTRLLEIPVTTMPLLKVPIHFSYLHQLAGISERLAEGYLETALRMCAVAGFGPSVLLHPLDFLGREDVEGLDFFPAMNQEGELKRQRLSRFLDRINDHFELKPLRDYAASFAARKWNDEP
ncbi:MAG: polysaccharide deacetylase family protein [Acidimicrobiia bacterium]